MDADRVYVPLSSEQIVALDRETGALEWMRQIETALAPLADGDTLYVAASDELHALDATTGDTRWRVSIVRAPMARMVAVGGLVVVLMEPDDVLAFHRGDGTTAWRVSMGGTAGPYHVSADATTIYLTAPLGRVIALSPQDGRTLWEQKLPGVLSDPALAAETVFVGSTDNFFYALDSRSGKVQWKWRSGGGVIGAAVGRDAVFYASLDNIVRGLSLGSGNQRWQKATMTRPVFPPRAVGDEVLIVGLSPALSTFDVKTGAPVNTWAVPGENPQMSGEPLIDPVLRPFSVAVVVITRDGRAMALRPQSMMFREAASVPLPALAGKPLTRERAPY